MLTEVSSRFVACRYTFLILVIFVELVNFLKLTIDYLHANHAGEVDIVFIGVCLCVCMSVCRCVCPFVCPRKDWKTTDYKLM